jgi:hypothetical protein
MPQCQFPILCYFCVSEKLHKKYSRNWTKKSQTFYFYRSFKKTEDETEGGQEPGSPQGGEAQPLAALPHGEAS